MQSVARARALAGRGLEGDRHSRESGKRQVLLAEAEHLRPLRLEPGIIKENLTVEGLPLSQLRFGQRLQLGTEVVAEVRDPCEPCHRMDEIRMGLREELVGRRGVFVEIIEGGEIAVDDPIHLIAEEVAV